MGLEKYFSRRQGYKDIDVNIQYKSMNIDLRTEIWNSIYITFLSGYAETEWISDDDNLGILLQTIWRLYLKQPLSEYSGTWLIWKDILYNYTYDREWHEVYDLVEYMFDNWPDEYQVDNRFTKIFNRALKRENSGYRIINRLITPITNEVEIASIKEALSMPTKLKPVTIQLEDSIKKLSERNNPDYRGSIKESISAVESLCNIITGNKKDALSKALKTIENESKISIHSSMKNGFIKLYGWTSDDQGIRHALMDEPKLTFNEAKYMLVSCSAFVNYLVIKANNAGIDFQT